EAEVREQESHLVAIAGDRAVVEQHCAQSCGSGVVRCRAPSTRAASTRSLRSTSAALPASSTGRSSIDSAVPVEDAAAIEVVRRQLDLHAVTRVDPDAVAAHLAGGVADGGVAVVEDDLELAALVRLDDLALHLDLLFLVGYMSSPPLIVGFRHC